MPGEFEQLPPGIAETATAVEALIQGAQEPATPEPPELPEIPTLESQTPTTLGEGIPGFPADMPLPAGWLPVEVPPFLAADGYVVAFTWEGMAEEAAVDFSAVLLGTPSWIMGELTPTVYASTYILPFGNMSTGFQAHAFITTNPVAIEMDNLDVALIAFRAGLP